MSVSGNRKPDGRGGKRPGAGRKPGSRQALSVRQVQEFRKAAQARAKAEGKTLADIVLDVAYDPSESVRNRLAAIKLYFDKMLVKVAEGGEADRVSGATVFLPEKHPRLTAVDIDGDSK